MNFICFVIALIFGFMLAEARVSRAHEQRLRAEGAIEPPGDVYRLMAILYPGVFLLMGAEGVYRARAELHAVVQAGAVAWPSWAASGVVLFAASKALKYWAIRSLRERWTFRVLVLPERPLVTDGPYRYIAHPNYVAVVGEILSTAMMVGARLTGPVSLALFGAALWGRLRVETRALRTIRPRR